MTPFPIPHIESVFAQELDAPLWLENSANCVSHIQCLPFEWTSRLGFSLLMHPVPLYPLTVSPPTLPCLSLSSPSFSHVNEALQLQM